MGAPLSNYLDFPAVSAAAILLLELSWLDFEVSFYNGSFAKAIRGSLFNLLIAVAITKLVGNSHLVLVSFSVIQIGILVGTLTFKRWYRIFPSLNLITQIKLKNTTILLGSVSFFAEPKILAMVGLNLSFYFVRLMSEEPSLPITDKLQWVLSVCAGGALYLFFLLRRFSVFQNGHTYGIGLNIAQREFGFIMGYAWEFYQIVWHSLKTGNPHHELPTPIEASQFAVSMSDKISQVLADSTKYQHVLCFQFESLDYRALNAKHHGNLIMPFLSSHLAKFCVPMKIRHVSGSSDTDFIFLSQSLPNAPVPPYRLTPMGHSPLIHDLKEAGVETNFFHNFRGDFFYRREGIANYGFDHVFFSEEIANLANTGPSVTDSILLKSVQQHVAQRSRMSKRTFSYVINLDSHTPFANKSYFKNFVSGQDETSKYLNAIANIDLLLKNLYEQLPENTLLFIFGDHGVPISKIGEIEIDEKNTDTVPFIMAAKPSFLKGNVAQMKQFTNDSTIDISDAALLLKNVCKSILSTDEKDEEIQIKLAK